MANVSRQIPILSLFLGYAAIFPLVAAAVVAAVAPEWRDLVIGLAIMWGGALLIFLAGVRRGLSFFTDGGPKASQVVLSLALFCLGLASLLPQGAASALILILAGFVFLVIADPIAARHGRAPAFFVRLRPPQIGLAIAGTAGLLGVALLAA